MPARSWCLRSPQPSSVGAYTRWPALRSRSATSFQIQPPRSEEHTSELQSQFHLVCRLLLEKKKLHRFFAARSARRNSHAGMHGTEGRASPDALASYCLDAVSALTASIQRILTDSSPERPAC